MVEKAVDSWKRKNKEIVNTHLPRKMFFNTRNALWSPEKVEKLKDSFSPRIPTLTQTQADELTQRMIQEYREHTLDKADVEHSLDIYAGTSFSSINRLLRGTPDPDDRLDSRDLRNLSEHIRRMQNHILSQPEDTARTLYRYMPIPAGVKPQDYAEKYFTPGSRIVDPAFMSTTEDPAFIRAHISTKTHPQEYVMLEIVSPRGVSLQRVEERLGSLQSFEKERLLPASTPHRVVETKRLRVSVDDQRHLLHQQFRRGYHFRNPEEAPRITPMHITVIRVIDEEYAKRLLNG